MIIGAAWINMQQPSKPLATSEPAPRTAESIKAESEFLQYLNCKKGLKMTLKDPSSLKIISKPNGTGPNEIVYSATNSFGARMTDSFDCSSF